VTTVTCARAEGSDATRGNAFPNALSNALSALEFHSIAAFFIFGGERREHDPQPRNGEISVMNQ
jgi:hypothetical protein